MPDDADGALIPLRAGSVLAWLDGVDLRSIGLGGEALLGRVYVAVRAADWSTVAGDVTDLVVEAHEQTFQVSFQARHRAGDLDVTWHGRIVGNDEGTIECRMDGEAKSDFDYCRVGFCVLHPASLAGAPYHAHTRDGEVTGELPRLVAPQLLDGGGVVPPVPWFDRLLVTALTGETVTIESDGEPFELEDQRNWTDASFKSYVPPIRPGYPYRASRGQRFEQCITLGVEGQRPARVTVPDGPLHLEVGPATGRRLPPIGLGLPHRPGRPGPKVLERLAALHPDHLRVSLWTDSTDAGPILDEASAQALAASCPLEVALFVDASEPDSLRELVATIAALPVPVVRWLAYDAADTYRRSTSEEVARLVRDTLDKIVPGAGLGAGTASDFVRLNRGRTLYEGVDGLAWAISPSFHAADDRSVMENAQAQGVTVETARAFAEGRGLWVGPVELSRQDLRADPRQSTAIAAAWAVASLADLCAAGPDALTYFETTGPRGLFSVDGEPNPVLAVFEQLARMRGDRMRTLNPSVRQEVAGLITDQDGRSVGMVANLTARPRRTLIHESGGKLLDQLLGPYEVARIG